MSSLLKGLKFMRRLERDGDDTNDKKKKKKKEKKKKRINRHRDKERSEEEAEEMTKNKRIEEKKTSLRDEWMTMPYMRVNEEHIETIKTSDELEIEAKEKKIQNEIDAGMREPVTGMVYGLYDPKNPDAPPTVSSKVSQEDRDDDEKRGGIEEKGEMPLFGDGGASWRGKMLKRAQDRARSSGVTLEEVVNGRFGSVSALKEKAKGSASDKAHLQYKRHRIDDEDDEKMTGQSRKLEIGRDAKDKALLPKYSMRLQRSVAHTVEDGIKRDEGRRQTDRSSNQSKNQEEDDPINYDKLPDFDRGVVANVSRPVDHSSRTRDYNTKRFQSSDFRHQKRTRSSSRSRERSDRAKRSRVPEKRFCLRSRSSSPVHSESNLSDKCGRAEQSEAKLLELERHVTLTSAASAYKKVTFLYAVDDAKAKADLEMEKRNAFLYGNKKSDALKVADASDVVPPFASEQRPFQFETAKMPDSSAKDTKSVFERNGSAHEENEKAELNKLAAKALRAQMMGKLSLFRKLTEELNELEAKLGREKTAAAVSHCEAIGALPPLENEDMRYGPRKGKKKRADLMDVNRPDVAASLEELVREERMSSAHAENGNMDSVHARNIVRLGSRYKGTEVNVQNFSSGFDEEDQVDMKMLQQPGSNLTRRARVQREHAIAVNECKRWDQRTHKCQLCMKSPTFKKHLTVSLGEFTYLAVPNRPRLHPGHCVIVPIDHTCSVVQADEQVSDEITRFQSALSRMCEKQYGMSVVFIEQTSVPHRKKHTVVECIPVDSELALDTPLYFKQELMQANGDWNTHEPIIDTSKGGIKSQVPPTFSYFHIEWRTRDGRGGYAHVIEDEDKFPRDFGVNVVAGMLDMRPPKFGRREGGNRRSLDDGKRDVLAFLKDWEAFDWTRDLDGGEIKSQAQGD
ncbi:unnamed protein product [Peronospora belbahrii]|uniref:Cwf19-like C-terminal domain-containing protein n=1 Tax=Peronospora belbahrii TaxID=622444 RepID=A0AAU9KSE8_9STRA|nr:unnamed protein product [Peronospora belbahrii]